MSKTTIPHSNPAAFRPDDPELFMAMDDLEMVARGVVEGALHGLHRSPYLGFSSEFDSHREYRPGDDLRHVDWTVWARSDHLQIKQYQADTNMNMYLLLDHSPSMLASNGPSPKWQYAARAAAALAFLALQGRDGAGLCLLHDTVSRHIPPRVRPGQLNSILALLRDPPAASGTPANLAKAIETAAALCRRKGIVILISDMFGDDPAVLRNLATLRSMGHEPVVIQILDPWEAELTSSGQYELIDLESGERFKVSSAELQSAYRKEFNTWHDSLRHEAATMGIDWITIRTDEPLRNLLVDYLLKRKRLY
jgi:uncharacterized protein (DUF58 family)